MSTRDLADRVVVMSGLNNQNIQGTAGFLRALRAATGGQKPVSIVLSPVPTSEDDLREQRMELAKQAFSKPMAKSWISLYRFPIILASLSLKSRTSSGAAKAICTMPTTLSKRWCALDLAWCPPNLRRKHIRRWNLMITHGPS